MAMRLMDVRMSVIRRLLLNVIDDQDWLGALVLLQFQAELFVQCIKERDRAAGIR